ncbi:hypothetical protein [Glycomyces tenuis]|uniref:hypothetical protein n=1 Tax=Glycomyces tenuis TaxID=58116 RepID=UPI000408DFC7|nr:hypothetical protein [Glycomyces tenuis]
MDFEVPNSAAIWRNVKAARPHAEIITALPGMGSILGAEFVLLPGLLVHRDSVAV